MFPGGIPTNNIYFNRVKQNNTHLSVGVTPIGSYSEVLHNTVNSAMIYKCAGIKNIKLPFDAKCVHIKKVRKPTAQNCVINFYGFK